MSAMVFPSIEVLDYWLKNLPALIVAILGSGLAYRAAMSWREEYSFKRKAEVAEKILSSLYAYVNELKRLRSADEVYPFEASDSELNADRAGEVYARWQVRYRSFKVEYFNSAKSASILARIHFSRRAQELVEEIVAQRLVYVNAWRQGKGRASEDFDYLKYAQVLAPSKQNDDVIQKVEALLAELELEIAN